MMQNGENSDHGLCQSETLPAQGHDWWFSGRKLQQGYPACVYPNETAFAVFSGQFNGTGEMRLPIFEVTKIDSLLPKNPDLMNAASVAFEFWCVGVEPFGWDIEISNPEGESSFRTAKLTRHPSVRGCHLSRRATPIYMRCPALRTILRSQSGLLSNLQK
jgi:hypothetical protein